jgi:hypothetical protein
MEAMVAVTSTPQASGHVTAINRECSARNASIFSRSCALAVPCQ